MNNDKMRVTKIIKTYENLGHNKSLQARYADKIDAELIQLFDRNGEEVAQSWVDEVLENLK